MSTVISQLIRMTMKSDKSMSLKETVLSRANIFKAIYCMESYVFEKGLLSEEDLKMYVRLQDKYDFDYINKVIVECKRKLDELLSDKNHLFDVEVYFKIKKWDEESQKIVFRPIHTARLIDQICMVCILQPLMFDDRGNKRELSELTKLLPHNFYGNIPSVDVDNLFVPWKEKYKEYSEHVIAHCREYQETHQYRTEISLDIKNFFPSISPQFIFGYVLRTLEYTYESEEDQDTLKRILSKLLYFNIRKENLDGFEEDYYSKPIDGDMYMNCGIVQGLPQSYLFGNICMIEIYNKIRKIDDFKNGDFLFYVDDSVIYVEREYLSPDSFKDTINCINEAVSIIGLSDDEEQKYSLNGYLSEEHIGFQNKLEYKIHFHEDGKSEYGLIDNADINLAALDSIRRAASMANSIYSNLDESEDYYCKEKLERLITIVEDEIDRLKNVRKKSTDLTKKGEKDQFASRMKLLKRHKRYFKFRYKLLEQRLNGGSDKDNIDSFNEHFFIKKGEEGSISLSEEKSVQEWMDNYDEDIFLTEARLLINSLSNSDADSFVKELIAFETSLVGNRIKNKSFLYLSKDFCSAKTLRELFAEPYHSLERWAKRSITRTRTSSAKTQHERLTRCVENLHKLFENTKDIPMSEEFSEFFTEDTLFVAYNSKEYIRKILNAFYSSICEIPISDAKSFTKTSPRLMTYLELRVMARLRNRNFSFDAFVRAVKDINAMTLENNMAIDMGLMDVLAIYINNVRNPEWVDNIILTHRVVKGLWQNGSKFLHSYTLHNEEHAITLVKEVIHVVKAIDYLKIKRIDYYILFLACYLHDISMVIHPDINSFCAGDSRSMQIITSFITDVSAKINTNGADIQTAPIKKDKAFREIGHFLIKQFETIYAYFEDNIRRNHAKDSAAMIKKWSDSVLSYLSPLLLSEVSAVSYSHGAEAEDVYGLKSDARNSVISEKYMMILIRLADLLDVANDRINYYLLRQNVNHMTPTSQFHWISHLITDEIKITPRYTINKNIDEHGARRTLNKRKIYEDINVNLFINVKYLSAVEPLNCECCRKDEKYAADETWVPDEYSDNEVISLNMDRNTGKKLSASCPILCKWTMLKHKWLVNELINLQEYINSVNDPLIQTKFHLNVFYCNRYHLDSDLFDSTCDYINDKNNH